MLTKGYAREDIDLFEVPGAFEIPLHVKHLAESGRYEGIVAAGLVVDGGHLPARIRRARGHRWP